MVGGQVLQTRILLLLCVMKVCLFEEFYRVYLCHLSCLLYIREAFMRETTK